MPVSRPWWRRPTVIVVAGCLIAIITFGVRTSFGLFTTPLTDLRGWDRETFALAIAVQNLLWGLGQPFAGAVADRFGAGPGAGRAAASSTRGGRAHGRQRHRGAALR